MLEQHYVELPDFTKTLREANLQAIGRGSPIIEDDLQATSLHVTLGFDGQGYFLEEAWLDTIDFLPIVYSYGFADRLLKEALQVLRN